MASSGDVISDVMSRSPPRAVGGLTCHRMGEEGGGRGGRLGEATGARRLGATAWKAEKVGRWTGTLALKSS